MRAIQVINPKCNVPNFGSLEMSNFDIYVMHFVVTGFFGDPKFGTLHSGLLPCIAVTDYTWLILVIDCNNEVCSHSNNAVSRAFWKKKGRSLQTDVTLRVIYIFGNWFHLLELDSTFSEVNRHTSAQWNVKH